MAGIGLAVNLASGCLPENTLNRTTTRMVIPHAHAHTDHNLRSALAHVLADDAATSVLAIFRAVRLGFTAGPGWMP